MSILDLSRVLPKVSISAKFHTFHVRIRTNSYKNIGGRRKLQIPPLRAEVVYGWPYIINQIWWLAALILHIVIDWLKVHFQVFYKQSNNYLIGLAFSYQFLLIQFGALNQNLHYTHMLYSPYTVESLVASPKTLLLYFQFLALVDKDRQIQCPAVTTELRTLRPCCRHKMMPVIMFKK